METTTSEEILELMNTSKFMDHMTLEYLNSLDDDDIISVRRNNKLVGVLITKPSYLYKKSWTAKFELPKDSYAICQLIVRPEYQNKKIATHMIEEFIKKHNTKCLTLSVSCENENAIQFYEKLGWKKLGTFDYRTETTHNIDLKLYIYRLSI